MNQQENPLEENLAGTTTVFGRVLKTIFETGASHSFIFTYFVTTHGITIQPTRNRYWVEECYSILIDECCCCPVRLGERVFPISMLVIKLRMYDVVLGMNWLVKYKTTINCAYRSLTLAQPGEAELVYSGFEHSAFLGMCSVSPIQ